MPLSSYPNVNPTKAPTAEVNATLNTIPRENTHDSIEDLIMV